MNDPVPEGSDVTLYTRRQVLPLLAAIPTFLTKLALNTGQPVSNPEAMQTADIWPTEYHILPEGFLPDPTRRIETSNELIALITQEGSAWVFSPNLKTATPLARPSTNPALLTTVEPDLNLVQFFEVGGKIVSVHDSKPSDTFTFEGLGRNPRVFPVEGSNFVALTGEAVKGSLNYRIVGENPDGTRVDTSFTIPGLESTAQIAKIGFIAGPILEGHSFITAVVSTDGHLYYRYGDNGPTGTANKDLPLSGSYMLGSSSILKVDENFLETATLSETASTTEPYLLVQRSFLRFSDLGLPPKMQVEDYLTWADGQLALAAVLNPTTGERFLISNSTSRKLNLQGAPGTYIIETKFVYLDLQDGSGSQTYLSLMGSDGILRLAKP